MFRLCLEPRLRGSLLIPRWSGNVKAGPWRPHHRFSRHKANTLQWQPGCACDPKDDEAFRHCAKHGHTRFFQMRSQRPSYSEVLYHNPFVQPHDTNLTRGFLRLFCMATNALRALHNDGKYAKYVAHVVGFRVYRLQRFDV